MREVQCEQAGDHLAANLLPDRIFPAIPYRWELCTLAKDPQQPQLAALPTPTAQSDQTPLTQPPSSSNPQPLVLVSPDIDLFTIASTDYLHHFAAVLATAPAYRFLLWSAHPDLFHALPCWPANVELGLRITTQDDLTRLSAVSSPFTLHPSLFYWFIPLEPFPPISTPPYARLLLGGAASTIGKSPLDRPTCRRILAAALDTNCAIHLAAGVQQMLC